MKFQVTLKYNQILHISDAIVGSQHDFKIFKDTNLLFNKYATLIVDLGYLGIDKIHNNSLIPYKKYKNHSLSTENLEFNKQIRTKRISIEHFFAKIKVFKILKNSYQSKQLHTHFLFIASLISFGLIS